MKVWGNYEGKRGSNRVPDKVYICWIESDAFVRDTIQW